MFKLTEYVKDSSFGVCFQLMTPYEYDSHDKHNLLNIKLFHHSWWWKIPELIKPKFKWVDTSHYEWSKNTAQGYTEEIQKNYGFGFYEDALHVHYGIQPGCWSSNDPVNSDHVKVINYFWNLQHVYHYAYDIDSNYLCNGTHYQSWELSKNNKEYNKETKNEDFENNVDFIYPLSDRPEDSKSWFKNTNFSAHTLPSIQVLKTFDYTDSSGFTTRARVNIEERKWVRGKWLWLRLILNNFNQCVKISRTIEITFRDQVGPGKGSWKGGTLGCSFEMYPNETIDECFARFQSDWKYS